MVDLSTMIPDTLLSNQPSPLAKLGVSLDSAFTAEQAMEQGFLGGWNLRKEEMYTPGGLVVPGRRAMVRTDPQTGEDEVLGDVGANYRIIPNEEHAAFLDTMVGESGAHYETAGTMNGGRYVFLSMKLPGHILVGGSDRVDMNLVAINTHDGSRAFTIMVTPIRFDCGNVMALAFSQASHVLKVRHSKGATDGMVAMARDVLELSFTYLDGFQEEAERLIQTTMTQVQFEELIAREFGPAEDAPAATVTRANQKLDKMAELFADSHTNAGIRDTAWAGLNAMTEWFDHHSNARTPESLAQNALLDGWFKNEALRAVREFAAA